MKISSTEERVVAELLERMMTPEEMLSIYGTARLVKQSRLEAVPAQPVEGAVWPVRDEVDLAASLEPCH